MSETVTPFPADFADHMVRWQRLHGRQSLPWQNTQDPYRVWLSEIMLQQTQVSTVLDYFARFLSRFPDVAALAAAEQDDVLALWSGLGYYSRARNMHRCAQEVMSRFGGEFPRQAQDLETLPGIGRSTAAAIAAFCFQERVAILDGNVKRVLTRVLGFADDLAVSRHERQLWHWAEKLLPKQAADMPRYTQALMDLGATLCLPRKTQCATCPVHQMCKARAQGEPLAYPVKTRKLKRSSATLWLLWAENSLGQVWLQKRPQNGIWAGLFSLPVFDSEAQLLAAWPHGQDAQYVEPWKHVLTHRDLHLHPVRLSGSVPAPLGDGQWIDATDWPELGLPAPIRTLLSSR
ncbi:A/G-specific adenine glycosylase [Limnohabitans sp. T6-5]|uniref:A/G-specific adenine glycosylase n=1 Tax=Limnohabitans sp. T6-5 TaxID=1100724 RepID=UPI000D3AAC57|nr:A/G-specific adenine glycosylase [Limnohabitans sp. T6-5]PUE09203.1 A/G-specific adenine glycosylase [Limnohabitans sp. T6-5]